MEAHVPIEEMELFRRYVEVADWIWDTVNTWNSVAVDTVGKQLIRAADSVGANLVEGDGRYQLPDSLRFFIIARASARETRYWLLRAKKRRLIESTAADEKISCITSATQLLNRLIAYRKSYRSANQVRENLIEYGSMPDDPFDCHWLDESFIHEFDPSSSTPS